MKTHRTLTNLVDSHTRFYKVSTKSLLILSTVILTTPVFQGCHRHIHPQDGDFTEETESSVKLAVRHTDDAHIRTLDAFVFNNDALKILDCYQRADEIREEEIVVGSCGGSKILLLCANAPWESVEWKDVQSLHRASSLKTDLEHEDIQWPVMCALAELDAGSEACIPLERLSSQIELRSVRCDFTGKPYEGEEITMATAYLTNVNATCSIVPSPDHTAERIINHGSLIPEDIMAFNNPDMITDSIGTIDFSHTYPGIRLLCYPNTASRESIGTPFTRLVLEGRIQGERWYWPIDINRGSGTGHEGIERNRRYVYDITITSKGTKDPDAPIAAHMAEITFETEKWKEKEPYYVSF